MAISLYVKYFFYNRLNDKLVTYRSVTNAPKFNGLKQ